MPYLRSLLGIVFLFSQCSFSQPTVAFFYGKIVPSLQLCLYDWVVVDPFADFDPNTYCNSISQPIAYASLGEVARDAPYAQDIKPEWVLGENKAWNNNFVMDQSQKDWQDYFLNQRIESLWQQGYRGFFLDTLDSFFLATSDDKQQQIQIEGMVYVIQQIKQRHPEAKIILNRGFQLLPQVHSQVDAVVIESLYNSWNQEKKIYEPTPAADQKMLAEQIEKIRLMQLPIIIIDYLPPDQADRAQGLADSLEKQGFIPWITDNSLQEIYLKKAKDIPRKVLIVFRYQGSLPLIYIANFGRVDTVLEHLGYISNYINLEENTPLPDGNLTQEYAGIIIFLDNAEPQNMPLFQWVLKQITRKIPVVFVNTFAIPIDSKELSQLNLAIPPINEPSQLLQITSMDSKYVGYEMQPTLSPFDFYPVGCKDCKVLLQVKSDKGQIEDAVAFTSWGGYALLPFYIQYLPNYRAFWIINPFEFFSKALHLQKFPIPDTTSENGRRMMTVHIDGDGFSFISKWIGGYYAAAELRDQILKKFKIPTSFSIITGEIAPNGAYPQKSAQLIKIARSIAALGWVEIASHSFSHPFNWTSQKDINGQINGETYTLKIPNYKFDLETEIAGSVDFINLAIMPKNKKCRLFFWSGLADPNAAALAVAYKNKLLNINGMTDTYIDYQYPSITGIQPVGTEIGGFYQIFAPIDGDFFFMEGTDKPLYGFEQVIQTFQLTDKPRRFKPIDIYYHIYAAAYPASLKALTKVYQWALQQEVIHFYISEYIEKILDFFNTRFVQKNDFWIIQTKGDLREFRTEINWGYPDLTKSQNIIGFRMINNERYVHFGPNPLTVLHFQREKPTQPYLLEANGTVSSFSRAQNQLTLNLASYVPLTFTLDNVDTCTITSFYPLEVTTNPDHTKRYKSARNSDEIHINCQ